MSEHYQPTYFAQQSHTSREIRAGLPYDSQYGASLNPAFTNPELIEVQQISPGNHNPMLANGDSRYVHPKVHAGRPKGADQSPSVLGPCPDWDHLFPTADAGRVPSAGRLNVRQTHQFLHGEALSEVSHHHASQNHISNQNGSLYNIRASSDDFYTPVAYSQPSLESTHNAFVNTAGSVQHDASGQYVPYQADFTDNNGLPHQDLNTFKASSPPFLETGQQYVPTPTGDLHYPVSQQYSPYQDGSLYGNGTMQGGLDAFTAPLPRFVETRSGTGHNFVGDYSADTGYSTSGNAKNISAHRCPSSTDKSAQPSRSSNKRKIPSSQISEFADSGNRAVDLSSRTPVLDKDESFDRVEEDEEDDDNEEDEDEGEHEDEDEEDAELVQRMQEGQHAITHEEESADGTLTPIVIIDAGGKGWGKIGKRNGVDVYFNPTTGKWQEYLTHDSMRGRLINRAQAEYRGEKYRHADPSSGCGQLYGITSFFKPHQNWGPEKNRANLPDCVFHWPTDPSSEGPDDDAEDDARRSRKDYPGPMMWGDKILLDHHNLPIVDHDIPATLSGNTPGYKLQAMRLLNPNVTQYDLWARMPREIERQQKGAVYVRYLGTKNTHVNMPMQRFRDKVGCIAGSKREGSKEIREGLLKLFRYHGFDPAESGSTRGFGRNLKPWERTEVKLGNAGNYTKRAGKRAVSEKKRKETRKKMVKSIRNGKKRDGVETGRSISETQDDGVRATGQPSREFHQQQDRAVSGWEQQQPAQIGISEHQVSHFQLNVQRNQDSEIGVPSKRRRTNKISGTEPKQSRRRKTTKAPQPQQYGAGGAPAPYLLSKNLFNASQPISSLNENTEGPFMSPEEVLATMPELLNFDPEQPHATMPEPHNFDWDEEIQGVNEANQVAWTANAEPHGPASYEDPSNGNLYGDLELVATSNQVKDPGMNGAPKRHSSYLERMTQPYKTQQILGKHRQAGPMEQWDEDTYVPQRNLVEQGPEEHIANEENTLVPAPKRRRMPATEGYYSPPVQAPKAHALKKARKAKREAHLTPPQLNINETAPEVSEAPQAPQLNMNETVSEVFEAPQTADEHPKPSRLVPEADIAISSQTESKVDPGTPVVHESPQVADTQGPDPPRALLPTPTNQEVRFDIRDVRPTDGWQSQSLHNALNYTREAYFEWTGNEVPITTNLEDSYNTQYREIEFAFEDWWRSGENPDWEDPIPELYRMKAWIGTVTDWKAPEGFEHLWEPIRRGKFAPRNENETLMEPQFHWNSEKYEWYDADVVGEL